MKQWHIAAGVLVALCVVALTWAGDAKTPDTAKPAETNKPEKVTVVYTAFNLATSGYVIQAPERKEYHGIPCLQGIGVAGYLRSKTIYIPIDKIATIVEFDSMKEWENSIDQYRTEAGKDR